MQFIHIIAAAGQVSSRRPASSLTGRPVCLKYPWSSRLLTRSVYVAVIRSLVKHMFFVLNLFPFWGRVFLLQIVLLLIAVLLSPFVLHFSISIFSVFLSSFHSRSIPCSHRCIFTRPSLCLLPNHNQFSFHDFLTNVCYTCSCSFSSLLIVFN